MGKRQATKRIKIPEAFGNKVCGVWPCIAALVFDAVIHTALFFAYRPSVYGFVRLFLSFIFFIYPINYVADILWSLQPAVCEILSGRFQINRKHYMNTPQREVSRDALLPVTVSIPVYTEDNNVIFETIRMSLAAAGRYREFSGLAAGVLVSDDGIGPLLGGICTKEKAEMLTAAFRNDPTQLSEKEQKAAERICFYREHGVGFVARPAQGRAGLFKKSSNLNYTLRLGDAVAAGASLDQLTREGGAFAGGYAEGYIFTHEIILLLDKDSGMKERIIETIVPEFATDEKLAYVQCSTVAVNMSDNYYTYATGHQINNLFHNIWPCKALQGFFVPLVGHNVFLRKSILEKSGLWAEDKVSEDFDRAICFYNMGYHGKYAQIKGLEFTEYVSRTFTEETGKQHRYSYGLFEMMFDGTVSLKKTRKCDILYMVMYFLSVINQVLLLPTVLLECYFGNIHLLWAGFILCNVCFIVLPAVRGLIMSRRLPKEHSEKLTHTVIVAISFICHSFSMLTGACRYFANKIKENRTPFPSTSVDKIDYSFSDGVKVLAEFVRKNKWFVPIAILCIDRGMFMVTRKGIEPVTMYIYSYILFSVILAPVLLTPPLFAGISRRLAAVRRAAKKQGGRHGVSTWSMNMETSSPKLVNSPQRRDDSPVNSDIASFLSSYEETLQEILPTEDMPDGLTAHYSFESCIRKDPAGKKEVYLLRHRDGTKALLRVTKDYPEEDALEEAKLLVGLDHPGIPKVYDSYEKDGKTYIVREYIEGRSLYEIVKSGGSLTTEDIFSVMLKLTDILSYLHSRVPPVIHRDIKPQNIIVGKDGSIHLIDFGIARVHKKERSQDTSVVLTLDYASPEQYGFEQTTPLSDIYSLGVVMLFMATGYTNRSELESQIVSNRLRSLIERCIAFNPEARFQSVHELQSYIRRDNGQRTSRRRRGLVAAASFVVVTACLFTVSYGTGVYVGENSGSEAGYKKGYSAGYTEGYEAAPVLKPVEMDTHLTSGNIPGNMTVDSGAFAAEGSGTVYYISGGDIYSMPMSGAETQLMVQGRNASALSYSDGWLYYSSGMNIMQTSIYTQESDLLCELPGKLCLADGNYYIQGAGGLYLLDTDTGSVTTLNSLSGAECTNIADEKMVFIDMGDRGLYSADLTGEVPTQITEECRSVCLLDGDIFAAVYSDDIGELVRISSATGDTKVLAEVNAVMVNATDKGVYYIDTFDSTINMCTPDGSIRSKISKNRAADFNIAGDWIFYHNEADGGRLWCVRLDGTNDHPLQTGR